MTDLPNPLTPADCDCRGTPAPFDMLVELLMSTFGFSSEAAAKVVREMAPDLPFEISEGGSA
ncbi:hypothetical protein GT625_13530 [Burkholderia thailandensis]|uniref:hypothetical protein n=1 Tax=Burkholderia thailandensis TaxID=57975 RepID=UPI001378333B|nr:hypothetical protein [Burkholderia thailandensis]NBJ19746.1 hypothetical protein [Burkholderia thailandensis]